MEQKIHQIYDKVFKKILTLSSKAVINLINGLFDTDYPTNSRLHYNWTEFVNGDDRRILADTIVTVEGGGSYHMEAQMTRGQDIVFRVFEYGFSHAGRNRLHQADMSVLPFPKPKIIYLYAESTVPDEYVLRLDFGTQGSFDYRVPVFKYNEISVEELNRRRMVILIPFELLKLRKELEKERSPENREALKKLIQDDIIGSIEKNLEAGNITGDDARRLKELTMKLYRHIYAHYNEMGDVSEMVDESLMLEYDIIEKQHQKELEEAVTEVRAEKDKEIKEKEKEIMILKKKLEEMERSKSKS